MAIDTWVENISGAVMKTLAASIPKCCLRKVHGLPYRLAFRMKYA